jgi:hypothetical protein
VTCIIAALLSHLVACLGALHEASSTTPQSVRSISFRRLSHENRHDYTLHPAACFPLQRCPALPSLSSQVADDPPRDKSGMRDENSPAIVRLVSLVSHISDRTDAFKMVIRTTSSMESNRDDVYAADAACLEAMT